MDKQEFVSLLKPVLQAIEPEIRSVEYAVYERRYIDDERTGKEEFVKIVYKDDFVRQINVTADSNLAIAKDILRVVG